MNRLRTTKFTSANPTAQMVTEMSSQIEKPCASFTFRMSVFLNEKIKITTRLGDNQTVKYSTERMSVDDILLRVSKHCSRLEDRV